MVSNAWGGMQEDSGADVDMELMDTVSRLEAELRSSDLEARAAAEQKLVELGPAALSCLSPIDNGMPSDLQTRLRSVRRQLETIAIKRVTQASLVNLSGERTLAEAIAAIQSQTQNKIVFADGFESFSEKKITCNWNQTGFWDALRQIMTEHGLVIEPYVGGGQVLTLYSPSPSPLPNNTDLATAKIAPIFANSGMMSIQVNRIDSNINFETPEVSYTALDFVIHWEPRLLPIAVDVPYNLISYTDSLGNQTDLADQSRVASIQIQPEINAADFSLQLPLVARAAQEIVELNGTMQVLVPGRTESFVFKQIETTPEGSWIEKANAKVTFGGIKKNEDLFSLKLSLSFEEENNALESHQGWVFRNRVFLKTAEGEEIKPIGFETFQQTNQEVGIQYLFAELPAGASLCYETPAAVVKLDLPFSLKRIPLP